MRPPERRTLEIPIFDTVLGGISVIGSIVGTIADVLAGREPARVVLELRKTGDP